MTPAPSLDEADVRAELLRRTGERYFHAALSALSGLVLLLAVTWGSPAQHGGLVIVFARVLTIVRTIQLGRRIRLLGGAAARAQGIEQRMLVNLFAAGLSWGAVTWLVGAPLGPWSLRDGLLMLLVVVVACVMLMTTVMLHAGMRAFYAGMAATSMLQLAWSPSEGLALVVTGIVALYGTLLLYGRQLHRRSREGVEADLRNRQLAAALAQANAELEGALARANELARHDPLTGALNRRALLEQAHVEAAARVRHGEPACVVLVDLDHFKQINDRHGHAAGDQVLVEVSQRLRADLRGHDLLSRWGGEEFLLLLPRTPLGAGIAAAERIREAVADGRWAVAATGGLRVTTSAGVALWRDGQSLDGAIEAADRALYAAKTLGRNRVEVAGIAPEWGDAVTPSRSAAA